MSHKFLRAQHSPQRPDCLAGHVRLELRNVGANYPFERSHRFLGIKPNSSHRDYSRLSCDVAETQLGPNTRTADGRPYRRCGDLTKLASISSMFAATWPLRSTGAQD